VYKHLNSNTGAVFWVRGTSSGLLMLEMKLALAVYLASCRDAQNKSLHLVPMIASVEVCHYGVVLLLIVVVAILMFEYKVSGRVLTLCSRESTCILKFLSYGTSY
jgi:hypothetical protein